MGDEEEASQAQLRRDTGGRAGRRAQGGPPRQRPTGPRPRPRPRGPAGGDLGRCRQRLRAPGAVAAGAAARRADAGGAHRPRTATSRSWSTTACGWQRGRDCRVGDDRLARVATYSFSQVDVFGSGPLTGNPVAVVHDATGLDDEQMAAFARWTNLSETTFLLPPDRPRGRLPAADLHPGRGAAVRRTPHPRAAPTPGSRPGECRQRRRRLVQECGVGLVELRAATTTPRLPGAGLPARR